MSAQLQPRDATGNVSPMLLGQLDKVLAVEVLSYSFPWTRGNFVDSLASSYRAECLWHDGELLAYCVAQPGADEMHLLNLTVAPRWRRQGHAQLLLARLVQDCLVRRFRHVWLEVRVGNDAASALYREAGFVEVGLRPRYYPAAVGREDARVMRLDLPTP